MRFGSSSPEEGLLGERVLRAVAHRDEIRISGARDLAPELELREVVLQGAIEQRRLEPGVLLDVQAQAAGAPELGVLHLCTRCLRERCLRLPRLPDGVCKLAS